MAALLLQDSALFQQYGMLGHVASIADPLALLLLFGWLFRARSPGDRWPVSSTSLALVSAFALWTVLSTVWSPAPVNDDWHVIRKAVEVCALFVIAVYALDTPARGRKAAAAYAVIMGMLALWIMLNYYDQSSSLLVGQSVAWAAYRGGLGGFDPNQTSFMLAVAPGFLLIGTQTWPSRARLAAMTGLIAVIGWALIIVESRTAFLALALGLAATVLFAPGGRQRRRALALILVLGATFTLILTIAGLPWYFDQRIAAAANDQLNGRLALWRVAIDLFARRPVFGIGAGGFEATVAGTGAAQSGVTSVHSDYLRALVDEGLIGFTVMATMLITLVRTIVARHRGHPACLLNLTILLVSMASVSLLLEHWVWVVFGLLFCTGVAPESAGVPTAKPAAPAGSAAPNRRTIRQWAP
jgi:O-antigen ligase